MYEVRRLRLLRDLSVHGTVAATAAACSLTPSAVSQQLSILEREVGAELLLRDGRGLVLTEAARVLVRHTERILAELEQAKAAVSALTSSVSGVLRLSAFATAAGTLVPDALAECRVRHPDLRIRLAERETPEALGTLKSGGVDVALVHEYNLLAGVTDPGVTVIPLGTEPLFVALPKESVLEPNADGELALPELRGEQWVAPKSDMALRDTLERACGLAGFVPDLAYTCDDYTVILALVRAGLGVSLVPRLAVEAVAAEVRLYPVVEPRLTRTVFAAVRAGSAEVPSVAALLAALRRAAESILG
ncbi:DNA-binding transcriptional LysR family regulator [Tamaricihabitans halophyticus]|uniref:DNA-binding transcriptional LysR family regulator n=1 Tax=Tamaricihabitans halophyticus TaxID=1262583 RepID=A0A4R2R0H6_9PSEU|nr:LysR family transcriptional regulator [Tamaricihabitans halophyticus]TCP52951.1 DNA-binding transcriptional LysR family regulator [Tamaricihabitans halophyticus]